MRIDVPKKKLLPAAFVVGMLALGSCTDKDFDFNEVDLTMGFGGDELVIPSSSTDIIKLSDVLDLEADGSVRLDADSNYVFSLAETSVEPARPYVKVLRLTPQSYELDYQFNLSSGAKQQGATRAGLTVSVPEQTVMKFDYTGHSPEVKSLRSASLENTKMTLTLDFGNAIPTFMPTLSKLNLTLPGYLSVKSAKVVGGSGNVTMVQSGHLLDLDNVGTSQPLKLEVVVDGLSFVNYDTSYGKLSIYAESGEIAIDGRMTMSMAADITGVPTASSFTIHSTMAIDEMVVTGATGTFDPDIDLDNLGKVDVTGVPDFLHDGNVCVDLYNPQIMLKVANDMNVGATFSGEVVAYKDGRETARVKLPDMSIYGKGTTPDDTTRICICRRAPQSVAQGWDYYEVTDLSSLIYTVPDRIEIVNPNVHADTSKEAELKFGHQYCVAPKYDVVAPLAFAENAVIVYKDSLDDWNDDVKDLELSDNAYVELTGDVESRVPVFLDIKAEPLDVNGKVIGSDRLKVEIPNGVEASVDGLTPSNTAISVKISQQEAKALQQLDGVRFTVTGSASKNGQSVTGINLNARDHTLKLTNIKVKVKGKVIGDFN